MSGERRDTKAAGEARETNARGPLARAAVWARRHAVELSLFLSLWCLYGAAINSANLEAFNLQQAGVEALVERRQLSLEGSAVPRLQIEVYFDGDKPFGDTFLYHGRQYAAKQPGQSMAGAVVYFFLRLFGLTYVGDYTLTAALVTFFTAALVSAAACVAVFVAAKELAGASVAWPLACALTYGLATTALAYSGVAHHDQLATGYLVIAFCLAVKLARRRERGRLTKACVALAGFLLGLSVTTSMLTALAACVVGLYLLKSSARAFALPLFAGAAAGLAPLLVYNALAFGNPLLMPNVAGGYDDTYLRLDLRDLPFKVLLYASALTNYVPVFWVGLAGFAFYPRGAKRERLVSLALVALLAMQVLNIDTHGGCRYGPRYLLPAMPFACLGLLGFARLRAHAARLLIIAAVVATAAFSFFVNLIGALYGAMYCATALYAPWQYLAAMRRGEWPSLPLAAWLAVPLVASAAWLIHSAVKHHKVSRRGFIAS